MKKRIINRVRKKDNIKIINKNIKIMAIFVISIFLFISFTLYKIIYVNGDYYIEKLENINNQIIYGTSAPRGRIYDRNYNVLVDNITKPVIIYKKVKNTKTSEEIKLARKMTDILDLKYNRVSKSSLKEFYYLINKSEVDKKITDEEIDKYNKRILTSNDLYNLKLSRITDEELENMDEIDKKASYIYFLMNNGYAYSDKIIKSDDVTDEEYSYILENEGNMKGFSGRLDVERVYNYGNTFKTILGNVGYIPYEKKNEYLSKGYDINDVVGTSYIEKYYEDILKGEKATYKKINNTTLVELTSAKKGSDIVLGIDITLQEEVDKILIDEINMAKTKEANTRLFNKSYVVLQEAKTGEILAMSGKQLIKSGSEYIVSDITPGIITSSYTPGSVVKGASMMVGYTTGAIDIGYTTTDECIKIKSTPKKCSSHKLGRLNDIDALAESSNVYQFKIAIKVGKGNYRYNQSLKLDESAFDIYRDKFKEFGLGTKTEIDLDNEQIGYSGKKKDTNLLLNFSIGQYDSYTPIELSQYITTIANDGNRLKPHLVKEIINKDETIKIEKTVLNTVTGDIKYIKRIQEGFRQVLVRGTGKNVMGESPTPAGKTGTSESFMDTNNDGVIDTETVSNAFVGYAPFENPEMTITVVSPDVEEVGTKINFHSYVNRRIARNISNYYFNEYK